MTTEKEYLEDNIATVAFHLGRPGARLSVQNGDLCGLLVEPGEVLKEISRRLTAKHPCQNCGDPITDALHAAGFCGMCREMGCSDAVGSPGTIND